VANGIAQMDLANEVVIVDVVEGMAEGKALDLWQCSSILNFNTKVVGVTNDYEKTKDSSIVVITSGFPRKPGMSRDDLIKINAEIVKDVAEKAYKYSPDAIFIVVTNPLDVMTYTALQATGLPSERVFGMAGILDVGRFTAFIADELKVSPNSIDALLLGGHGDTMVPLVRYTSVAGTPVADLIPKERLDQIVERTRKGGGELVKLMGTSAWYAPGYAVALMAESIIRDQKKIYPVCALLKGEFGIKDNFLGVPCLLGRSGIEKIYEIDLNEEEKAMLTTSANHVKEVMNILDGMKMF
ncbi:malate dehydrogenase, partial [Bacteroidota bacterium]